MNEMAGVLLLRRVRWWAEGLAQGPGNPAVDLSEDQLARKYRGIDGTPWPEELPLVVPREGGLAPIEHWPTIARVAMEESNEKIYDAIILIVPPGARVRAPEAGFLGFDVGFYGGEYNVFSSIYHEAIYSPFVELRQYASRLNDSLLLPTTEDAESYIQTRDSLRASGRHVEDGECYTIAVFGRQRRIPLTP